MRAKFDRMSRTAKVAAAVLAVALASLVSALLSSQALWLQMTASVITAVLVGIVAIFVFGTRSDARSPRSESPSSPDVDRN